MKKDEYDVWEWHGTYNDAHNRIMELSRGKYSLMCQAPRGHIFSSNECRPCIGFFSRVIDAEIRVYSLVDRHRRRYRRCYPMI